MVVFVYCLLTFLCWAGSDGPQVGVIMGSDSDLSTMKAAAEVLAEFGVRAEVTVVSAHRTPERMLEYARGAHRRGIKVGLLLFVAM
jgi:phosphoribosylaminoimidazole carboxylase PurE protein